jgi:hypothetical protein
MRQSPIDQNVLGIPNVRHRLPMGVHLSGAHGNPTVPTAGGARGQNGQGRQAEKAVGKRFQIHRSPFKRNPVELSRPRWKLLFQKWGLEYELDQVRWVDLKLRSAESHQNIVDGFGHSRLVFM